ncbi:hypothetical protein ES707_04711 [subsurface metagenome]
MEEVYEKLGKLKSEELTKKYDTFWEMQGLGGTRKSTQVTGAVLEGIARDFIREFLPAGFGLKSGLIFDPEAKGKKMSPQIDAIIYGGTPLLEFTDVVVAEKQQVKAIFEIKSYIETTAIFGDLLEKGGSIRDPNTGLADQFNQRKVFLSAEGRYALFTFELDSGLADDKVLERLKEICDSYAVVLRREPKVERARGKEPWCYNFDGSIGRLIEWLRNLS